MNFFSSLTAPDVISLPLVFAGTTEVASGLTSVTATKEVTRLIANETPKDQ